MNIKFRVWDKVSKKFLNPYDYAVRIDGVLIYNHDHSEWTETFETNYRDEVILSPIVQQFTGLVDKNGREIYEGDILKFKWCSYDSANDDLVTHRGTSYVLEREKPYQKLYIAQTFGMNMDSVSEDPLYGDLSLDMIEAETCEVIGNIYENPELLVKH